MRRIHTKYWSILSEDPIVGSLVTKNPLITYRKAGSVGESLLQFEYRGEFRKDPYKNGELFHVGHVHKCTAIKSRTHITLQNGEHFLVKHFVHCKTKGVIYLMQCQCGSFYKDKTRQELVQHVGTLVHSMRIGNL